MANALAHGIRPKRYECRFMAPGLTNYPGEDGNGDEMWYLSRNMMNKMQDSFVGCPVVVEARHDGGAGPDNFKEVAVGVVSDIYTDKDGWDCAKFIVWDGAVQGAIEDQGYNVSCTYNTMEYDPGGVLNAINYDHEVTDAEYIHLAIVAAPRQTGSRIFINSLDSEQDGVINFECSWEGKMNNFKLFPNGRKMMNAEDESFPSMAEAEAEMKKRGGTQAGWYVVEDVGAKTFTLKKINKNAAPPGWEKTVEEMKGKPGIEEPFALAWYMKEKGYKTNGIEADRKWEEWEGWEDWKKAKTNMVGQKMIDEVKELVAKGKSKDEAVAQVAKDHNQPEDELREVMGYAPKKNKEDNMKKINKGIDLKNAIIETPNGDVKLQDMINAYEATKKNEQGDDEKKKKDLDAYNEEAKKTDKPTFEKWEEWDNYNQMDDGKKGKYNALIKAGKTHANAIEELKDKNEDKKINMDDEIEGVKVSAMYEAYKKNADAEAALKSEGKSDDEIESIMKSEAETIEKERK
ncbi:MAG: DUF2213 domain-containing protein, partial [Desulfobacteraceae bacterium]|nr:DUF2213 domain-containing protein [Desulfobacteraceae bacterium]